MTAEPTWTAIFTYGTLRPGQYNARLLTKALGPGQATASLPGHTLYANRSRSYPYLVADPDSTQPVTGTLYMVNTEHPDFAMVRRMELGAGYHEETVTAVLPDGREVEALAWLFNHPEWLGARIAGGDWVEWERHNFPDWSGAFANVTRD